MLYMKENRKNANAYTNTYFMVFVCLVNKEITVRLLKKKKKKEKKTNGEKEKMAVNYKLNLCFLIVEHQRKKVYMKK